MRTRITGGGRIRHTLGLPPQAGNGWACGPFSESCQTEYEIGPCCVISSGAEITTAGPRDWNAGLGSRGSDGVQNLVHKASGRTPAGNGWHWTLAEVGFTADRGRPRREGRQGLPGPPAAMVQTLHGPPA